jgi:threonine-phosphate decarboxylase
MAHQIQRLAIDRTHGGVDWVGMVDFSTSLNPLGPPPEALEAYKMAVADIYRYPPAYPRALESHIADWLGVDHDSVLTGNGSTHLIYLLARVLKLRSASVAVPTFSEIANAFVAAGSTASPLYTSRDKNFRLDPSAVHAALRNGADGIFFGRPNSPTGSLMSLDEAAEIIAQCHRHDAWCVLDEAFIEFADDRRSVIELIKPSSKLLVLRSLTKIFAIPGLRLGYLVGSANNLAMLRAAIEPWSVNVAAAAVARACLSVSSSFIEKTRDVIAQERSTIERDLSRSRKLRVFRSSANFIMVEVADEGSEGDFARYLQRSAIVIRDLGALPGCGPGFYRLGIRAPQDNARLLAAVADY